MGLQRCIFKFLLYDKYHVWPLANHKLTFCWNIYLVWFLVWHWIITCNQLLLLSSTACVWLKHRFPICSSASVLFAATSHCELVQIIRLNPSNPCLDTLSPHPIGTACVPYSPVYPTAWSDIHTVMLEEIKAAEQLLCHCSYWLSHQFFCNPQLFPATIFNFALKLIAELDSTGTSSSVSNFQLRKPSILFCLELSAPFQAN